MSRLRLFLLLAVAALAQGGCADSSKTPPQDVDANGQPVSSVPWNKPESWETSGQLGGLTQ